MLSKDVTPLFVYNAQDLLGLKPGYNSSTLEFFCHYIFSMFAEILYGFSSEIKMIMLYFFLSFL